MIETLVFCVFAYLLGSVPFAVVVCKPFGVDPRKEGSGNPGATNVARLLGKKWGLVTLAGDILKAIVPVLLAKRLFSSSELYFLKLSLVGFSSFVGHLYSIFLSFRGGKGVATSAGVLLVLCPKVVLVLIPVFVVAVAMSGFVSVGSLLASALAPILTGYFCPNRPYLILSVAMAVLIWIKHRDNIKRLLRGEEKSWRKR